MRKLPQEVINFFRNQGCVIVSTIDAKGFAHNSCKGLVKINRNGLTYLLDLYRANTYKNLKRNPHISITAFDEHKFIGYCLKGRASLLPEGRLYAQITKAWEARIASRITQRLLKNIREEKGHPRHPEALLPKPEYLIVMQVEETVGLTPHHLK